MKRFLLFGIFLISINAAGQDMLTLMQKAVDHFQKAEYAAAIPPAEQAAVEVRKLFGEKNVYYRALLTIQATSHKQLFNYLKAEALFLSILNTYEDKKEDGYAACLNNLATLYNEMGLYTKAEPLLLESMELTRQAVGDKDSTYTYSLNNLAGLYHSMGLYAKAEPLYIQAI